MAKRTVKLSLDVGKSIKRISGSSNERYRQLRVHATDSYFKTELGKRAIDYIIDRTLDNKDKNGKGFKKPYSKMYVESDQFKIYGKSKNDINLKLTGEMHAAIDVLSINGTQIVIGIDDDEQAQKALGHINGANSLPVRDFWGLSDKELDKLTKELIKDEPAIVVDETEFDQISVNEAELLTELDDEGNDG